MIDEQVGSVVRIGDLLGEKADDFAKRIGMSKAVVERLCREGTFPSFRIGGKWFLDVTATSEMLKKQALNIAWRKESSTSQKSTHRARYRMLHPDRQKALTEVHKAISSGMLKREPCEVCGIVSSVEAHHEDYSKPLSVKWLCRKHHLWIHSRELKENKNGETK